MKNNIDELTVGASYRGKGKKGMRCSNARSQFYGQYLDRKIIAIRYIHDLKTIEVDFEVRSTRGKTQTKTTTIRRFVKWTQGEVDENMGHTPNNPMQPTSSRRAQRASRNLDLSDDRERWELSKAPGNITMARKVGSITPSA